MEEFRVNSYITLRFEGGKTNIYIGGKLFDQCKGVVITKKVNELVSLHKINSVDKLANHSLKTQFPILIDLPSKTEFWVHCSNLQVWAEHDYNTNLLHSNLGFPMLKRLVEVGDPLAKKVFKEEIIERLENGGDSVILFILDNFYLENFTRQELIFIYESFISKFMHSKLLLPFLRALSLQKVAPAISHYRTLIKKLILTNSYKEKKELLKNHISILLKDDLIYIFENLKSDEAINDEEGIKFNVLDTIMTVLRFQYNISYQVSDIVEILLCEDEQRVILEIFNTSKYPYTKLDFQADEIRHRVWENELYYEFNMGHVVSIEVLCDSQNSHKFYKSLGKLESLKYLKHINILFFCEYNYNYIKRLLLKTSANIINLYNFSEEFQVFKVRVLRI